MGLILGHIIDIRVLRVETELCRIIVMYYTLHKMLLADDIVHGSVVYRFSRADLANVIALRATHTELFYQTEVPVTSQLGYLWPLPQFWSPVFQPSQRAKSLIPGRDPCQKTWFLHPC